MGVLDKYKARKGMQNGQPAQASAPAPKPLVQPQTEPLIVKMPPKAREEFAPTAAKEAVNPPGSDSLMRLLSNSPPEARPPGVRLTSGRHVVSGSEHMDGTEPTAMAPSDPGRKIAPEDPTVKPGKGPTSIPALPNQRMVLDPAGTANEIKELESGLTDGVKDDTRPEKDRLKLAESLHAQAKRLLQSKRQEIQSVCAGVDLKSLMESALRKEARRDSGEEIELEPIEREMVSLSRLNDFIRRSDDEIRKLQMLVDVEAVKNDVDKANANPPSMLPMAPLGIGEISPAAESIAFTAQVAPVFNPPSPQPQAQAQQSAFARFISNPLTWSVACLGAFTALIAQQRLFSVMAQGVSNVVRAVAGKEAPPPSIGWVVAAYSLVAVSIIALTELFTYKANKRQAREEEISIQRKAGGPTA
jgi:hypothetical protein